MHGACAHRCVHGGVHICARQRKLWVLFSLESFYCGVQELEQSPRDPSASASLALDHKHVLGSFNKFWGLKLRSSCLQDKYFTA